MSHNFHLFFFHIFKKFFRGFIHRYHVSHRGILSISFLFIKIGAWFIKIS